VGAKIAVCSTSNEKAVQQIVNMLGKERASKIRIFAGDCVPRKKPSPDIYNLAKETLGVKPDDVVVIEDRSAPPTSHLPARDRAQFPSSSSC
jgi:HAD superfamily hydrolase (TIGR01509 family)